MLCNITNELICNLKESELTKEEKDFLKDIWYYYVEGIIGLTIAIIGFIMNTVTTYILRTKSDLKQITNYLVSSLLIINNIFLVTKVINILVYGFRYNSLLVIIPYLVYPVEKTSLTAMVFCTVCLAHQVYLITLNPQKFKKISSSMESRRKRTMHYMLPVTILATIINLPRWFTYYIEFDGEDNKFKKIANDALKKNFHYAVFYENFVLNILTVFASIALLVFFNMSVFYFIREKQREIIHERTNLQHSSPNAVNEIKESNTKIKFNTKAHILIIIIFLFIICHFPRCFLKFYDGFYKSFAIDLLQSIERTLTIIHASVPPFVYLLKNGAFRGHLLELWKTIRMCKS